MPGILDCTAQEVTLEMIEAAWKKREATFQSFEVRWTLNMELHIPALEADREPFRNVPLQNQILSRGTLKASLIMSGEKLRWDEDLPAVKAGNPRFASTKMIQVWDGETGKSLRENPIPGPVVWVAAGKSRERIFDHLTTTADMAPIVDQFRPILRMKRFLKEGKLLSEPTTIEDKSCAILELKFTFGKEKRCHELWICPAEDFAILRIVSRSNGAITGMCDRAYRTQADGQVILDCWKRVTYRDGVRDRTIEGQVTHCALNPKMAKDAFELSFPPGTFEADRGK